VLVLFLISRNCKENIYTGFTYTQHINFNVPPLISLKFSLQCKSLVKHCGWWTGVCITVWIGCLDGWGKNWISRVNCPRRILHSSWTFQPLMVRMSQNTQNQHPVTKCHTLEQIPQKKSGIWTGKDKIRWNKTKIKQYLFIYLLIYLFIHSLCSIP
jgi:hypothetical protein